MAGNEGDKAKLKKFGLRLKRIRMAKGFTLVELGYKIDKDPQSISRVEMGKTNPTLLHLLLLSEGLNVDIDLLMKD